RSWESFGAFPTRLNKFGPKAVPSVKPPLEIGPKRITSTAGEASASSRDQSLQKIPHEKHSHPPSHIGPNELDAPLRKSQCWSGSPSGSGTRCSTRKSGF